MSVLCHWPHAAVLQTQGHHTADSRRGSKHDKETTFLCLLSGAEVTVGQSDGHHILRCQGDSLDELQENVRSSNMGQQNISWCLMVGFLFAPPFFHGNCLQSIDHLMTVTMVMLVLENQFLIYVPECIISHRDYRREGQEEYQKSAGESN